MKFIQLKKICDKKFFYCFTWTKVHEFEITARLIKESHRVEFYLGFNQLTDGKKGETCYQESS